MKPGIYIHIPFCRMKCDYCSFYSIPVSDNSGLIGSYVDRVISEISALPDGLYDINADTLYFGGGTPSILKPEYIERIIDAVSLKFNLEKSAEITLEMNPDDLSKEKIKGFTSAGINRIVLGVQSLDDDLRNFIGRRNRWCSESDLDLFFSCGDFIRCIDLITGIPGQSGEKKLDDLRVITGFRPHHISLYLLSVEEHTPLAGRFSPDDSFEQLQVEVWTEAMDYLANAGYNHYEISNYSIPGYEAVHNSKYWHFVPYAGFGAGAHSFTGRERYSNEMDVMDYIKSQKTEYTFDKRGLSDIIVEFFITALRDLRGCTIEEFKKITGIDMPDGIMKKLGELQHSGLIEFDKGRISLTRNGLFKANDVIYRLTEEFISK